MNRKLIISLYSAILLMVPFKAFAIFTVEKIIDNVMTMVLWPIFGGVAIIMTFWAGYLFLSANGDPTKVSASKKVFLWVIVGIAIAVGAQGIMLIVKGIFGL